MDSNGKEKLSVDFDLDVFGDEDDDLFAQAYDDTLGTGLEKIHAPIPPVQPSTSRANGFLKSSKPLCGFDVEAGKTWIYPMNYPLREYQYAIVEQALYKNTLVSLPTGLGKTFIAAVVMYNFYRWYPNSKIIFMAPTKPLVAQQVEACFNVVGLPQAHISQMTGSMNPVARVQEWKDKRIFFLTPQVLTNDFVRNACPAELIKCLVLDEAHRATGNHSYCQVVKEMRDRRCEFRVLALSATPGSDMKAVKQVLNNLMISHIELRNEDSPDITPYSHHRNIEKVVVSLGEELTSIKNKYLNILRIYVNKLLDMRVLYTRDETTLSKYQLLQAREAFRQNPPENLPRHRFGVVEGLFALCVTLYHAYDLMLLHGTRSAYKFLKGTLGGDKGKSFARSELLRNDIFKRLMDELSSKYEGELNQTNSSNSSLNVSASTSVQQVSNGSILNTSKESYVISHPKMAYLCNLVVEHHQKHEAEGNSTRIMIFSQYRDSVLEITEMLQHHNPLVKAMSFVGQGSANRGGSRGISQKEQLRVVKQFKEGGFNTLVSTCVGEEGLDIGDVDLIVCYDAPKSPIRLVQRMGRTGRKREGRIVVLVTKGKEEQMYNQSQYQKKNISNALANKDKLNHMLYNHNFRMVPAGITPICQKLHMKVDVWETNSKKSKKKSSSLGSFSRLDSDIPSSSKEKRGYLSKEEWNWYKETLWIPHDEVNVLPKISFKCLNQEEPEIDDNVIDFGSYQPWQTSLHKTHEFGHSLRAKHLVQLTEFLDMQDLLEEGEDPYGLEMATFLDMAYVNDDKNSEQVMAPSPKINEAKKGSKKKKKSQSSKKKVVKNNALITSMFAKISSSNALSKPKETSQGPSGSVRDNGCSTQQRIKEFDNDIIVLDDDFVPGNDDDKIFKSIENNIIPDDNEPIHADKEDNIDKRQMITSSPKVSPSEKIRIDLAGPSTSRDVNEMSCNGDYDVFDPMNKSDSSNISNVSLCDDLPPPRSLTPVHIRDPPDFVDMDEDSIDDRISPSEVMMVIENYVSNLESNSCFKYSELAASISEDLSKEKDTSHKFHKSSSKENKSIICRKAIPSIGPVDTFYDEELPSLNVAYENKISDYVNRKRNFDGNTITLVDSDDDDLPDLGLIGQSPNPQRNLSPAKTSVAKEPIKIYAEDSTFLGKSTIIEEQSKGYDSPIENIDDIELPVNHEVSPILSSSYRQPLRTNLKVCSSTPKIHARKLFKIATPDLTAIEKNSMFHAEESCEVTPNINLRNDNKSNESNACFTPESNTNKQENVLLRIRSKLSKFSLPTKLESVPEVDATKDEEFTESENKNIEKSPLVVTVADQEVRHRKTREWNQIENQAKRKMEDDISDVNENKDHIKRRKIFHHESNKTASCVEKTPKCNGISPIEKTLNEATSRTVDLEMESEINEHKGSSSDEVIEDSPPLVQSAKRNISVDSSIIKCIAQSSFINSVPRLKTTKTKTDKADDYLSQEKSLNNSPPLIRSIMNRDVPDNSKTRMPRSDNNKNFKNHISPDKMLYDTGQKGDGLCAERIEKMNFDDSLDEDADLFAEINMDEFERKAEFQGPSQTEKINGNMAEGFSPMRFNSTKLQTQSLLSITQIIDIVDDQNNDKSSRSIHSSSRFETLSKSPKETIGEKSHLYCKSSGLLNTNLNSFNGLKDDEVDKKEPLLEKKTTKPETKTEENVFPNFSLMGDIDFNADEDLFTADLPNPTGVNFDLLGTQEFHLGTSDRQDKDMPAGENTPITSSNNAVVEEKKSPVFITRKEKNSTTFDSFVDDIPDSFITNMKDRQDEATSLHEIKPFSSSHNRTSIVGVNSKKSPVFLSRNQNNATPFDSFDNDISDSFIANMKEPSWGISERSPNIKDFHNHSLKSTPIGKTAHDSFEGTTTGMETKGQSFSKTPKKLSFNTEFPRNDLTMNRKSFSKSPNLIPLTQDTAHVWKRRERKACNVVGSDSEDHSFHESKSETSHSNTSIHTSGPRNTSKENTAFLNDDDDDFRPNVAVAYRQVSRPQNQVKENYKRKKKSKMRDNEFIDKEAEVSCNSIMVSSDESEHEDGYENDSFVDDCTQLSQDPAVDIKAMYLKSIVSPVKNPRSLHHRPALICLSDTDEHTDEPEESEDSFVVDNDVVEYNTEYLGESMLAEDSIMLQAIEDNYECNKKQGLASKDSRRNKRKRIILNDSSSEDESKHNGEVNGNFIIPDEMTGKISNCMLGKDSVSKKPKRDFLGDETVIPRRSNPKVSNASNCVDQGPSTSGVQSKGHLSASINSRTSNASASFKQASHEALTEKEKNVATYRSTNSKLSKRNRDKLKRKFKVGEDSEGFDITCNSEELANELQAKEFSTSKAIEKSSNEIPKSYQIHQSSNRQVQATNSSSITENTSLDNQIPCLVLVDSQEVNGGGHIVSRLKLHHKLNTSVVQLVHGQYAVSARMSIMRIQLSVFSSHSNQQAVKMRVKGVLSMFEKPVIIVESDRPKQGESPYHVTHVRSKHLNTIICAAAQLTQLKLLYSNNQDETADLIAQLAKNEKIKGCNIPILPAQIQRWQQVIHFYKSLPRVNYVIAACLARNFKSVREFFNSSVNTIQEKGYMTHERATDLHQLINRSFRKDMLLK